MAISAADVKALRTQTGAGMMDCKRALTDADGDLERAMELLRERGLAKAGKRAGRTTSEGAIGIAIHGGVASLVELGCETDFVARTDDYQALVQEIADLVAGNADLTSAEKTLAAALGGTSGGDTVEALTIVEKCLRRQHPPRCGAGGNRARGSERDAYRLRVLP